MKIFPLPPSLAAVLLLASACSRPAPEAAATAGPAPTTAPTSAPVVRTIDNPPLAVESRTDQAAASWTAIKDYTFDQRSAFLAGAAGLIGTFDGQVAELKAKRAALPGTVDTKDWDFAMANLVDSQSYLKSMVQEAGRATSDVWDQEKEKVDQAWQKAQDAFEKVKTTTTSS